MEIPFERHLEILDISAIAEWDVLAFLYRHGTTIASAAHMVRLIGYSQSVVASALDNLTKAGLIQSSHSDGITISHSSRLVCGEPPSLRKKNMCTKGSSSLATSS